MAKQEKSAAELYREERKARLAKAAKQNAKGKKSVSVGSRGQSVISIVVVAAIIIGIVSIVLNSFGIFNRGKKIMQVAGMEVDQYEVVYYANQTYQMYAQYAMYGYLDYAWDVQPDEQAYPGEIEGIENPTYADFFIYSAKEQLRSVKACVKYAEENGITLDASELADVEKQIAEMKQTASNYGYGYPNFLRSEYGYGKGMTPELFEKILTEAAIAQKVSTVKNEEFTAVYTDEKLEEIYLENLTTYGVVSYRAYSVKAVAPEGSEELDFDAAKITADALAAIDNEGDFLLAVSELEKTLENEKYADYITDNTLTLKEDATYSSLSSAGDVYVEAEVEAETEESTEEATEEAETEESAEEAETEETEDAEEEEKLTVADWLFDEEREAGETCITKTSTGFTVYMVHESVHKVKTTYTYDVRHILLQFPKDEAEHDHDHDHEGEEATEETAEEATEEATEEVTEEATEESTEATEGTEAPAEDEAETEEEPRVPELLDTEKYKDKNVNIYIDVDLENTVDAQLYMKTQDILIEYLEGELTAEAFGELAKKYSEDGETNVEAGGLYEDVAEGDMVAEFESWALAEGREAGDVGIVETEYGYHIMYFVEKTEATSWSTTIKEEKVAEDEAEFSEGLLELYPIENYNSKREKTVKKELNEAARVTKNSYSAHF